MTSADPPNQLTKGQERKVLMTTAIVSGMGFADMMAVNTALPVMQVQLDMDAASALWVAEIYLLFVASLMMMGGALGDRFGYRRALRYGIWAFAASSLLCAASTTGDLLIFARATQGLAAAVVLPSSLAMLNACFPPGRRGKAIGTWTAISSMMIPLGPLAGGTAVDFLSWHWIFIINLPLCIAALIFLHGVPKPPFGQTATARLDIVGVIGITSGLGALVFGLLEGARRGWGDDLVLMSLIAAAVLLPLLIVYEAICKDPMLPLWMFRRRSFVLVNIQTFLFFSGFQGALFLLPFFHIQVFGLTALQAGAAGLPITIAMVLLSRPVGRLMDKYGAAPLLASAPFLVAGGLFWLAHVPVDGTYFRHVLPPLALLSTGMGFLIAPLTTVALNAAGEGRSGLASAVNNTMSRVAGLVSVAMMGVLLTNGFTKKLTASLDTMSLDVEQMTMITAQIHRLGTLVPPASLSPSQAEFLSLTVKSAFTAGFSEAVLAASVSMVLAGLVGLIGMKAFSRPPG
jgi:EmrB/QacA subfamily drug resistance transporter